MLQQIQTIYQLDGGTFTSRKGSLTGFNTDFWTFTQFGNYVIASNGVDAPQYYLMGTSTNFANLSTIGNKLELYQHLEYQVLSEIF